MVALPLATRFRGVDVREAVLFEGPEGWTEFSPFLEYDDAEASTWLAAAIDFGWMPQPAPRARRDPRQRHRAGRDRGIRRRGARALRRLPHRQGEGRRARVSGSPTTSRACAPCARRSGPEGRIRIDANGAWNVDEAEHAIHALAEFDLEYAEQPCASVDELAELRRRVKYMGIPIAADESVRKAADPLAVARAGAADLLVIKAQPLGGVRRALAIVAEAGLPAVVSSALDTSVGLAMGVALAAALPDLDYDCGLGTAALFTADVVIAGARAARRRAAGRARRRPMRRCSSGSRHPADRQRVVARPHRPVLRRAASAGPRSRDSALGRLDDELRDARELRRWCGGTSPRSRGPAIADAHRRALPDREHQACGLVGRQRGSAATWRGRCRR